MASSASDASSSPPSLPLKGISHDLLAPGAGVGLRVGIVHSQWNAAVIDALVDGARRELLACGVLPADVVVESVPGAFELPLGAKLLLESPAISRPLDAVICVGCLIKGETMHFEYICEGVSQGITRVGLDAGRPVIFGVLAVLNEHQARMRAGLGEGAHNHGEEWAQSAIKMALLRSRLAKKAT